ncbi:hypothetical protein SAMN04488068_2075 [Hydrocarboniphaga daqingensis]|uniref:Glutamine amidotransferase type-2 domain-containing protein n=1 Tax=Hydrocarboniphaga daqingensis TaxID=490188 RepID=A0A1M5P8Q1_9GAMM|nr:class II glutamine amidotransferase [Hydrocarboniphaga daqingensis]SHG97809.1 hypothetical protein SAMN04488068_2075 [Hydrocarboniphaga daqingensis]
MCVILHKPAGVAIAPQLLRAAASLNRDGWGLMGFDRNGRFLLQRHARVDVDQVIDTVRGLRDAELALHLRMLTRGSTHERNLHPVAVDGDEPADDDVYLMHNGTIGGLATPEVGHSDSWHFARRVLGPLLRGNPDLLDQDAFRQLVALALGPDNKAVLLQRSSGRLHIINRHYGAEFDGLWCSSTRWIDQRLLTLRSAPQPQQRSLATERLHFI